MQLNLPQYTFKIKNKNNQRYIFDEIRKKFYVLTPEEWVRQHVIRFLIEVKHYPKGRIGIEVPVRVNGMNQRIDALLYDSRGNPFLMVECKRPSTVITQETFDQIARYNQQLNAKLLLVTNGIDHYCFQVNHSRKCYDFCTIPKYIKS